MGAELTKLNVDSTAGALVYDLAGVALPAAGQPALMEDDG
jgi:hypothetical protein